MDNLIKVLNQNGNLVVSSREVARNFEKEHKHVMEAIRELETSVENSAHLFIPNKYKDSYKREQNEYLLTRDGFTLLAMGFTGKKGLEWKLKYIEAFNRMEEIIKSRQALPNNLSPQLQVLISMELKQKQLEQELTATAEKAQVLEHRINSLDATNIDGTSRQRLNDMVRKYAYDNGILYPQAWKNFRRNFNTAYRTNLETKKGNYMKKHNIKKLSYPEYLERVGLIEDALRVADKMLNQSKTA